MAENDLKTIEKQDIQIKKPKKYKVILFNDDYTTFEFVISILMSVFRKNMSEAEMIASAIHQQGSGVAGIYTYDIAQTKAILALNEAKKLDFPLLIDVEAE